MTMQLPRTAALLIIDLQRAIDHPSWGRRNNPDAEGRLADLLAAWRPDAPYSTCAIIPASPTRPTVPASPAANSRTPPGPLPEKP